MGYITKDYADERIEINPEIGSIWSALSDENKDKYIDFANLTINRIHWIGSKLDPNQLDQFPRDLTSIEDEPKWGIISTELQDRIKHDTDRVPDSIRESCCEIIIASISGSDFNKMRQMQDSNIESFSVSSVSFNFGDKKQEYPLPKESWRLVYYLSRYWWNSGGYITRM